MTRLSRLSLLAFFVASVLLAPFAVAKEDSWTKYNRKVAKIEEKRVTRIQKLQVEHQKFLAKQDKIDIKKLRKHELELRKKTKEINDDYLKELQKLERERDRGK